MTTPAVELAYPFTASCGCAYTGWALTAPCEQHDEPDPECSYCGEPTTGTTGSDWCGRVAGYVHPDHHAHHGGCE